jgi:hypothetical protein
VICSEELGRAGFWDIDEPYVRLSEAGEPLGKLNTVVPWEVFRKPLAKALKRSDGAKGGRPPFDAVMMFKIMVLQALYSLSDDQAEFQIHDRFSFMRFLGQGSATRFPTPRRPGRRRTCLPGSTSTSARRAICRWAANRGCQDRGGAEAAQQRCERADIKAGKMPDECQKQPAKLRQKDRDARWTVKFSKAKAGEEGKTEQRDIAVPAFGYKNHASIDRRLHPRLERHHCSAYDGAQLRTVLYKNNIGSRPADERGDGTGQWPTLKNPRLRAAQVPQEPVRMDHRYRAGKTRIDMANLASNFACHQSPDRYWTCMKTKI